MRIESDQVRCSPCDKPIVLIEQLKRHFFKFEGPCPQQAVDEDHIEVYCCSTFLPFLLLRGLLFRLQLKGYFPILRCTIAEQISNVIYALELKMPVRYFKGQIDQLHVPFPKKPIFFPLLSLFPAPHKKAMTSAIKSDGVASTFIVFHGLKQLHNLFVLLTHIEIGCFGLRKFYVLCVGLGAEAQRVGVLQADCDLLGCQLYGDCCCVEPV